MSRIPKKDITKNAEDLVFLDECGIDDNEESACAYRPKGKRVYAKKIVTERLNIF